MPRPPAFREREDMLTSIELHCHERVPAKAGVLEYDLVVSCNKKTRTVSLSPQIPDEGGININVEDVPKLIWALRAFFDDIPRAKEG